jgi:alginate O-acetyltransferase complex protein AlgJ
MISGSDISSSDMGLLARHRRPWVIVILGLLAAPMAVEALQPSAMVSEGEARMFRSAPAWPRTWQDWVALPRNLDRYLGDHFGLRAELVRAHGLLHYAVDLPSDLRVIIGRDNWLFLNGDGTIEQATGKLLREAEIARFADRAAALNSRLKASNARLLVTIPPNSSTINRARLPAWAAQAPPLTEYDLMMKALTARGVPALDLRPALLAANTVYPTYRRTDTHWNKFGALIAYDAVVSALGKPDWTIDPARVVKGFEPVPGGDLARLLAVSRDVSDEDAVIDLSAYGPRPPQAVRIETQFEDGGDLVETGRDGPTVVVIGDSFTRIYWQDYFALHAGRYVWVHHEQCGFLDSVIEAYNPAIVVLAPVERQMFCGGTK